MACMSAISSIFGCQHSTTSYFAGYFAISWPPLEIHNILWSMDMVSQNFRILVVDSDCSERVANLLKSKYEVVTAATGEVALDMLLKERHGISLVVTELNLPDMSAFEFLEKVETETRLPIVMISDTFDDHIFMRGLSNGGIMFLMKPLCDKDITYMWQLPIVKKREVMFESGQPLMPNILEESSTVPVARSRQFPHVIPNNNPRILESSNGSHRNGKRKIDDDMQRGHGWSMGQGSASSLQQFHMYFSTQHQQLQLQSQMVHPFATPGIAPNPSLMMGQAPNNNYETTHMQRGHGWFMGQSWASSLQRFHMYYSTQHQLQLQSQMIHPCATPGIAPNPLLMMGQAPNHNYETTHRAERETALTTFMRDPYCREQLKSVVRGSISRWAVQYATCSNSPLPPLSWTTVCEGSTVVPMSVPIALANELERFIFDYLNARYGQTSGFIVPLPQRMGGNGEQGLYFLDARDAEAVGNVITELLND